MVCATEGYSTVHDADLPFFLELIWSKLLDQFVDLSNGLLETVHHVLWSDLQLVDESVDFVDEENWLHLLLECLSEQPSQFEASVLLQHKRE